MTGIVYPSPRSPSRRLLRWRTIYILIPDLACNSTLRLLREYLNVLTTGMGSSAWAHLTDILEAASRSMDTKRTGTSIGPGPTHGNRGRYVPESLLFRRRSSPFAGTTGGSGLCLRRRAFLDREQRDQVFGTGHQSRADGDVFEFGVGNPAHDIGAEKNSEIS